MTGMATSGERIVIWLSGLLLAAVLLVLYAPVIIGALFSVVNLQRSPSPRRRCWRWRWRSLSMASGPSGGDGSS